MATPAQGSAQSPLKDGGLVSVLEINLIVSCLAFVVLALLRWRKQRLKYRTWGQENRENASLIDGDHPSLQCRSLLVH